MDFSSSSQGHGLFGPNRNLYKSAFSYSSLPTNEGEQSFLESEKENETKSQYYSRAILLFLIYALFVLTLPVSLWFSLKKVKSLERCIIYRLGKRLPLKGPGLVLILPCVDVVDFVDLSSQEVDITEKEQILTSDGSVVEINDFIIQLSITNAIASSINLKDSKQNVKQFVKLSFCNMVASTHLEDLEKKMEMIVKNFIDNCNRSINRWGWSITFSQLPRVNVLSRAEPKNPLISALKGYFKISEQKDSLNEIQIIPSSIDPLQGPLQMIANRYRHLGLLGIKKVNIKISISGQNSLYQFDSSSGLVEKTEEIKCDKTHLNIKANSLQDLLDSIENQDSSKIEISLTILQEN